MAYTVNDKRGQEKPQEVCRGCGCKHVHTVKYNSPTMECIKYLREENKKLEAKLKEPCKKCGETGVGCKNCGEMIEV